MDYALLFKTMLEKKYYTVEDLRYNQKIGVLLSKDQFAEFLEYKDRLVDENFPLCNPLPLKTFNSEHCFYMQSMSLVSLYREYLSLFLSDYQLNQNTLFGRNAEDMLISRLFSEVEGSLKIENVPTTHKRIVEIHKKEDLTDQNDIIVKNMISAIEYIVKEKPAFNKENLRTLYCMLSQNCLAEELTLKDGQYYRDDKVFIGEFEGADAALIDTCMDSLFAFANDTASQEDHRELLPYICHYYILYVHPYFDYNGRTARMVSFWLNYIYKIPCAPYFISEAINESKGDYYRAIVNTRLTNNDLTYFLEYILKTSIQYSFVYKNLEEIKRELSKTGDTLTSTEWVYVKKIIVHNTEDYFNYKMFLDYIGATMTKQGAYKILNNLCKYDLLLKSENKKGDIIYRLNPAFLTYKYT